MLAGSAPSGWEGRQVGVGGSGADVRWMRVTRAVLAGDTGHLNTSEP